MQFEMFATSFEQLLFELKEAEVEAAKANAKVRELTAKRNEDCPHTEVERKSEYFSGSYLDTSYTRYWDQCTCCGKKSAVVHKDHGWYS